MNRYLLALDQGTTSSRAIVFDSSGETVGSAQREHPQIYPRPGWVEHDPEAIWATQNETAREALARAGIQARNVAALGIANQRETTLLWDRTTGQPLHNAIVWQDRRTAPECERLRSDVGEAAIAQKTGLLPDPYFSGTKLAWLLDRLPGARERAERGELAFGTVDSFLVWRLTGGRIHATDATNASRTLLFDIGEMRWDPEMLEALRIPAPVLPEVVATSGILCETEAALFGRSLPIASLAGDQQAAAFGQACFSPGQAKNTYGTGAFLLSNTGVSRVISKNRLLGTVAWTKSSNSGGRFGETAYALEGSLFVAGAAIQWLRDELRIVESAEEAEVLALSVPDTQGVTLVPAFAGLGAPYWDAGARGALLGLTRGAGRAHLCRAALEAVCFQTRDVLDAMERDSGRRLSDLRADGGMARNSLMLQMQADLLGIPVLRPANTETTALGAAWLAGLAAGIWADTESLARGWKCDRVFEPRISEDERESRHAQWRRAVERVRSDPRPGKGTED